MVMVTVLAVVIMRVMTVIMMAMAMALVRIMTNSAHRATGTSYANTLRLKEA